MMGSRSVEKIKRGTFSDCDKKVLIYYKTFLFVIAIVTITIFSKSSFLYPLNDWVDSNCFFTVGKSIMHGKVPYRDLYEQKGPLLYFIHALAASVSSTSFLGIYLIEVISCYAFLIYSYKTLLLYVDGYGIYLMPVLSWLIFSSVSFCHGDSAEELCLPFLTYSLFVGMKYIKTEEIPSFMECLYIGITSSCVLWIKYTMLGFYIGWVILPAILMSKNKKYKELLRMILTILLGVIIVTIPILFYFFYYQGLGDLFTCYFYNNIFAYGNNNESTGLTYNIIHNLLSALYHNPVLLGTLGCCAVGLRKEKKTLLQFGIMYFFTSAFVFLTDTAWPYYAFILNVFTVFGLIAIVTIMKKITIRRKVILTVAINLVTFILCFFNSSNTYLILEDKENLPQYKFKKIIEQVDNPTLLNYGFLDGGFYTTCNIVPNCKYFCQLNIQLDEMYEMQDKYIEEGLVDFVVTRDKEITSTNYYQVSTASYYFEGSYHEYYLYQLQ